MKAQTILTLLCTAAIGVFAASARAADLRVVGSTAGMEVSVDVDSIKNVEGSHLQVNSLTVYREPQRQEGVPAPFRAVAAVLWFRCLQGTGSISKMVLMADADPRTPPVAKHDLPVRWRAVDPKTDVGRVFTYVCTRTDRKK